MDEGKIEGYTSNITCKHNNDNTTTNNNSNNNNDNNNNNNNKLTNFDNGHIRNALSWGYSTKLI